MKVGSVQVLRVEAAKAGDDVGVLIGAVGGFAGVLAKVHQEERDATPRAAVGAKVLHVAQEFPVPFTHRPLGIRSLTDLPVERVLGVRAGSAAVREDTGETAAVQANGRRRHAGQFGEGREEITGMGDLVADFVLGNPARPGDDGRQADAALEEAELGAPVGPRATASEVGAFFG